MRYAMLIIAMCALAGSAQAQHIDVVKKVADEYMAFYAKAEIDSLDRFLTDDAVFEDTALMVQGRTEFIAKLKAGLEGFVFEKYDIQRWIRSGRHHTLAIGVMTFTQPGREKTLRFEVPLAVGLKVVDGKVARHVDYLDMVAYMEQLEAQR